MKRRKLWVGVAVVLALIAAAVWRIEAASSNVLQARYPVPAHPLAVTPIPAMAKDGERLARLGGCMNCHGRDLTGRVSVMGWFGTRLVAPNLTGISQHWTTAQLAAAIRYGVRRDGTSLIAMPSARFLRSSDEDIAAIIAYLQSLTKRPNATVPTEWHFGGRAMLAMGLLPLSAEAAQHTAPGPVHTPTETMALGRYLTQAHCSACHGSDLSGEAEQHSPDLRFAIKHYSLKVFERFFDNGIGRKGHGTQVMTPLIEERFHNLTDKDVAAIFVYLNNSNAGG